MLEKALKGRPRYWAWLGFLLVLMLIGAVAYIRQLQLGMVTTNLSRDMSWGFYIAQFTYLVGLAASGVMIVLPYYFHDYKPFKHLVIFGEFMAIAAVCMCLGFIVVDIGIPQRMMNMIFFPTPNSVLFWDMMVLMGYLFLNVLCGWASLQNERMGFPYQKWLKPLIIISVIWAFSIHTVTAFLYQGLPGRHFWLTAILAARFLASAFCSGPAILLLVLLITRKVTTFEPGRQAIGMLAKIITYAMCINIFFFLLEVFTAFYSNIPGHKDPILFMFSGFLGYSGLVPWMLAATTLAFVSLALLIPSKLRNNLKILPFALVCLIAATWIDKGLALLIAGFNPTPFHTIVEYWPSINELLVSMAIFAMGAFVITILFKIATEVKKDLGVSQQVVCNCGCGCDADSCSTKTGSCCTETGDCGCSETKTDSCSCGCSAEAKADSCSCESK